MKMTLGLLAVVCADNAVTASPLKNSLRRIKASIGHGAGCLVSDFGCRIIGTNDECVHRTARWRLLCGGNARVVGFARLRFSERRESGDHSTTVPVSFVGAGLRRHRFLLGPSGGGRRQHPRG